MKRTSLILLVLFFTHYLFSQNFVKNSISENKVSPSGSFKSLTFNGSWCWFSDPRAVYFEGIHKRTYTGWVDNYGDIHVAYYDHETGQIQSRVISDNLEIDDHANPSILIDENGRILVFFNMHMKGEQPLFLVKSSNPEDIENWGQVKKLYLNDKSLAGSVNMNHTYTNPVMLSAENNRIFLFWRGVDGKPGFSFSDDKGENWSVGMIFFMPEPVYKGRRPYMKIYSDGVDKIHICLTDGHPRDEKENSIYYMYYKAGSFFKADGTKIRYISNLPVTPVEADLVYNAPTGKAKAWNWGVAIDEKGFPVIAGLARILTLLPDNYPNRGKFEQQFKEMANKLLSIQAEDGLWRVSLDDPKYLDIGESSGSSFFTFALAWGINNGLVEEKYKANVEKAWTALCKNVNNEGRLGFVQQVAGDPYPFFENQWHVYATGAFLLAGKEMYKLVGK
jgi:hypothetical protein